MAKSQAEWMAEALAEMKKAQWPPQKWCQTIDDREDYQWALTHNYKAQVAMWNAAHPAPTPPPQLTPPVNPNALYVVFCAENPAEALHAPAKYAIAFSADMAYRDGVEAVIDTARKAGRRIAGWCDCRPSPGGTPAIDGKQFVGEYGLDYFIGQAESEAEMKDALSVHAKVVVGNITATGVAQLISPEIAFIQEDYWNEGWARANDPRIAAYCAGVYPALWAPNVAAYQQAGRWREGDGIYYARPDTDWQNLP